MIYRFARWFFGAFGLVPASEVHVSAEAEAAITSLRALDADIPQRLTQAVRLEAALVPDDLVTWAAKVSAKGVVGTDDLAALDRIIPVAPRHPNGAPQ